ncbi:MAG: fibronectin type III domain-containing protein, partial [Candidatus Margulisiibacteriota bacterium]
SAYVSDTSDLPNLDNMLFALGVGGDAKLIYAKRVGSDGSFTWADAASTAAGLGLLVSTYTDVDHPSLALTYPSVANIGGGSALVAWTDNRNDTVDGTTDIYGQKLALADGSLQWAGAGLPVCIATGNQTYPRAAKIADGVSIVTWTDARAGRGRGTLTDIYAQKLDAAGAAQWTENGVDVIIGTGNNTYSLPHAAVDSTSGYSFINMVADNGAGTYGNLIQVLDGNGAKLLTDPFQVVTSSDLKNYPDVAAIGSGAAILTWDTDIYSQKISGLGAPPAPEPTPAPSAPSNFSGTALSQNSIRWTWQDNATDESSCVLFNSGGTAIATVGASVTSHDESGLLSNTSYSRSVKAFNANGYSNSSNTKETYTMAGVPTELATTAATIAALTFSWNGDGTKYSVERSASQGGSWSYLAGDSFSNAISVKNYTDSNLTQNTAYWYRIRAYNGDGVRTDPSSEKEFTTLQAVVIQEPTITQVNPAMRFLSTQSQTGTFSINGSNFRSGATLTLKKSGQADIQAENISISPDASTINFSATLPPKTSAGGIGYWDIIITNTDGGSFTLPKGFLFDYPEGEVFFYPTYVSPSKINALGTAGQPRIAYSLSADKDVDIYIYDIREAKVVFHRKYAKGQTGGKFGYNEIIWNGITDFGSMIPNGSYILQAFLDGKMLGQTYFTVSE